MPLQLSSANSRDGLCLLSLDAGGTRSTSQLKILAELMHRVNFGAESDSQKRPCDVFDMIMGVGSGGLIAILLVVLGLSAEKALEEFIKLGVDILEEQERDAEARTTALKKHITELLRKYNEIDTRKLLDPNDLSKNCKLVVPIAYKHHVGSPCILRNFESRLGQAVNLTIAEAMLATLATPPLFLSTSIFKDAATIEYIGGDFALSNPTAELITQAYESYGTERQVACVLSIGCGRSGAITTPDGSDQAKWNQFLEALVMDSEQKAQTIDAQIGHLGLYHRFYVVQGLERDSKPGIMDPGKVITHTSVYLSDASISRKLDICVDLLKLRDGISSLEQLKRSGGPPVLASALPPLTKTFVMRKEPWDFAEKALLGPRELEEDEGQRILVVTGIGGCGKTQLMLKFLRVHSTRFISSCFVDGSSEARIRADIIRHVRSLGAMYSQMNFDDCLLILSQSSPQGARIILYDNVDDLDINIMPLLPSGDDCFIVITSRNHSMGAISPETHLELDKMSMEEAVKLLLYSPNRFDSISDQTFADARAVAEALDCLPIALQQARSYMRETGCSTKAYLERLRTSRDKLLAHTVKYQREMRYLSTYAAFDASFRKLYLRAQQFLRLLSFLHWHKFPLELVILAANRNFSDYGYEYVDHGDFHCTATTLLKDIFLVEGIWDLTNLDELTATLQNYSLITLVPGVGTTLLEIHPLLHGWVHSSVSEEDRTQIESAAIVLLAVGAGYMHTHCKQYFSSHVMHLSSVWGNLCINEAMAFGRILHDGGMYEGALHLQEKAVAWLRQESSETNVHLLESLSRLVDTYRGLGRFDQALTLQKEILDQYKVLLGEHDIATITAANGLAYVYSDLGRFDEALELSEEVLKLHREISGERHRETIAAANHLSITYSRLGRLDEALAISKEVLRLSSERSGERHPDTISATSTLAAMYYHLNRIDEALGLFEEVHKLRREIFGERHPDTITATGYLAVTYSNVGRLDEALVLNTEVLKLHKEILGEHHPDTLITANNLASTYFQLRRVDEAVELFEEVMKLRRDILGEHHLDTIMAANSLAVVYSDLGRLDKALLHYKEVLRLRREVIGNRHPDTISAANNLGIAYFKLGRFGEALGIFEEVLKLRRDILGERHLDTIVTTSSLADTYYQLGRLEEALGVFEEVLKLRRDVSGERHPDTIIATANLANMHYQLRRFDEALEPFEEVLKLLRDISGESHPNTIIATDNLANTYYQLGLFNEALGLFEQVLKLRRGMLGERHLDTIAATINLANTCFNLGRL